MNMKTRTTILMLLFCAMMLSSCSRAIVLVVFNNTGEEITVVSFERDLGEKVYRISDKESKRIQYSDRLAIRQQQNAWNYDVKPVPRTTAYMTSERYGPLLVKLQVEKSGAIFILAPETLGVVTNFALQPSGYPLRPNR